MTSPINPNPVTEQNEAELRQRRRDARRKLLMRSLVGVIVLAAIAWGLYYFLVGRWYEGTDDAYVNGNVVQITPQIPGTVVSIGADDNDYVREGQVLVKLDPADADYARRKGLAASGAISAEELAHARDALVAAQSALAAAEGQLAVTNAVVEDTTIASHPDVKAAAAKVRAAWLNDMRTTLVAPVSGYVAKRTVQVGQRVQPGTPLMAVVPLHQVWVDANFKETQLEHMRIGQPVTLTS